MSFIIMQSDTVKPRNTTNEPAEHFGICRSQVREFIVLEFLQLQKKATRRQTLMYAGKCIPSRDTKKGYQKSYLDWVNFNTKDHDHLCGGPVILNEDESKSKQLWLEVGERINVCTCVMIDFMATLGISYSENIPFLRMFHSREELKEEFIKFLPRTFTYGGICGSYETQQTSSVEELDNLANLLTARSSFEKLDNLTKDLAKPQEAEHEDNIEQYFESYEETEKNEYRTDEKNQVHFVMESFENILTTKDVNNLCKASLDAISTIERVKNVSGSMIMERKEKSLFARWRAKPENRFMKISRKLKSS